MGTYQQHPLCPLQLQSQNLPVDLWLRSLNLLGKLLLLNLFKKTVMNSNGNT